jgi:hypothetical protein
MISEVNYLINKYNIMEKEGKSKEQLQESMENFPGGLRGYIDFLKGKYGEPASPPKKQSPIHEDL